MGLLGEVDQLRRELGEARSRIGYLERLADEDPLMPVANRRAFVRELTRMMSFTQRYSSRGQRRLFRHQRTEADQRSVRAMPPAMRRCCMWRRSWSRTCATATSSAASAATSWACCWSQTDRRCAEQKAAQLAEAVAAQPLSWQGQSDPARRRLWRLFLQRQRECRRCDRCRRPRHVCRQAPAHRHRRPPEVAAVRR